MQKGFTLIDVLVGSFLVTIIFVGIFGAYQLGFQVLGLGQSRVVAINTANEEMEKIRNLPYASVGTVGAELPFAEGSLSSTKVVARNNTDYTVETRVKYIVDSTDGLGSPEDPCPNDYKRVDIGVSWGGIFGGDVSLVTDIVPQDLAQECSQTGGVLDISVFDAYGAMVISPLIEVYDAATDELVDSATPDSGHYYFSVPAGEFKVVVSKSGWNSSRTYGDDEVATPEKPDPDVGEGEVEQLAFSIDDLSSFEINTLSIVTTEEGEETVAAPGVGFSLVGDKKIGWDEEDDPVFKFSEDFTTNSQGQLVLSDMEWDNYMFSLDPSSGLVMTDIVPSPQPVGLDPGVDMTVDIYVESDNSLLFKVQDVDTLEPIFSAQVHLFGAGYDDTQYTDDKGQTYFIPLNAGDYNFEIEATDYTSVSGTVSVSGLGIETVQMERVE